MSFMPHFRALIPKAEGILRSIGRILPNLHGPREKKRRLYSSVIHSVLLYGAPVWWRAVVEDQRIRRAVQALQRRVPIRARESISLKDIGLDKMTMRRGLTGAFIFSVRGKEAAVKADQVAEALGKAVPEAKIARPQRTRGGVDFGLYRATVVELRQRPLRCHRCLARGHVAVGCPSPTSRASLCHQCGQPGHKAGDCQNKAECPVCRDAGHKNKGHRAGSWECPVVPPRRASKETCAAASASEARVPSALVGGEGMEVDVDLSTPTRIVNEKTAQYKGCDSDRCAGPAGVAGDLLIQRMRECGAGIAVIAEPWWVPPGDEKWFSSLGGAPLSAVLVGESRRPCSLVHRGNFFVAVKWGDSLVISVYFPPSEVISKYCRLLDELEELLGRFPTSPVLVAGDFNARAHRWDPEGRSNLRGELLSTWANRLNLHLFNRTGCPTCVRPQGSSVIDLTWGSSAASVRLSEWRVDEAESLSDHVYVAYRYCHETAGIRSLSRPGKTFPRWNARAADEDMLDAALISGDWTRPSSECSARVFVRWLRGMLVRVCDMALPRAGNTRDRRRKACWWSQELSALRAEATAARRRFLKARRSRDQRRMELCLEARRETKRQLKRAIRKAKAAAWRDFVGTLEADPWGRPYRLVMGKLRPYSAPMTEVLEPEAMDRVLGGLFPQMERNIGGDLRGVQVDGAAVTLEEVLTAARKIAGGKA
ncbi:hypothetical protein M0804_015512, partial [Polistes exclamans]